MKIYVLRYSSGRESTLGLLFIDGKFECYTLEDEARTIKVYGETRIPSGKYKVELRKEGGFHGRYSKRFPDFHQGMLHIRNVPGYEYILIHIGNTDDDTAGCLLVGNEVNNNTVSEGIILSSTIAYTNMYKKVIEAFNSGDTVEIEYNDRII